MKHTLLRFSHNQVFTLDIYEDKWHHPLDTQVAIGGADDLLNP